LISKIPPPVAAYRLFSMNVISRNSITEVSASHSPIVDCAIRNEIRIVMRVISFLIDVHLKFLKDINFKI
tara:strand:+ start:80 stop:289 length:210 start_codon:yes stop_codon:yes gene_type:complete